MLADIDIVAGSVRVRLPAHRFERTEPDLVAVTERKIVAVGNQVNDLTAKPGYDSALFSIGPAFEPANFDPRIAGKIIQYSVWQGVNELRLGWRAALVPLHIRIRWPDWKLLPAEDRMVFLEQLLLSTVDVNGAAAVRPIVDLPIVRIFVPNRIRPDPG